MSKTYKYTISRKHVFVDNEPVLMYYIENMPFAFDVLERSKKKTNGYCLRQQSIQSIH